MMFSETYAGRHRPDGPRGDEEARQSARDLRAQCRHRHQDARDLREVIDLLARLDGIDFRQTAPVRPGLAYIRPYGEEWIASEDALTRPIAGINPTMITRAGALDQGNIILNLQDVESKGIAQKSCSWPDRRSTRSKGRTARRISGSGSRDYSRRSKFIARANLRAYRWRNTCKPWRRSPNGRGWRS